MKLRLDLGMQDDRLHRSMLSVSLMIWLMLMQIDAAACIVSSVLDHGSVGTMSPEIKEIFTLLSS